MMSSKSLPEQRGSAFVHAAPTGTVGRREFFRKAALALGAAAAGAAASQGFSATTGSESHTHKAAHTATSLVLTPGGKLIQAPTDTTSHQHPGLLPQAPTVRAGVLGGKWIIVIDLAKCDGCKVCLDLSGPRIRS